MKPAAKNKVESLLMTAYKMPYSATIFESEYSISQQYQQQLYLQSQRQSTNDLCDKQLPNDNDFENNDSQLDDDDDDGDGDGDDDDDDEADDDDEDEETTTNAETITSHQNTFRSISHMQMQQRRKHPRKPQNRLIITR